MGQILMKYLNTRSLLLDQNLQAAEVTEAVEYAAATLREGSPPGLD